MNEERLLSVSRRRSLFIWGLFCVTAGMIFLVYTLASLAVGRGEFVMPLDDAYIHFQYARQIAAGQPYVYNPGLPPSSGATSFLYPWILAVGYLIGFQGLNLGLWAMGIGALALVGSLWLVYKLVKIYGAPDWLAVGVGLVFGVSGPMSWHFMSGMETGLVVLFTLGTVYSLSRVLSAEYQVLSNTVFRDALVWATGMALIRPEGAVLTVLVVGAMWWQSRQGFKPLARERDKPTEGAGSSVFDKVASRFNRRDLWLLIPVLAIGVQPAVNLALTGSAVASGNAAKSIFGTIPFYPDVVIGRIAGNFAQMWAEFFTGISPREGLYIMPLMLVLAVIGIGILVVKRESRLVGLVVIGWLVGGTLLVATLDTAFWHFKRYQMPFLALVFPLGAVSYQLSAISKRRLGQMASFIAVAAMGLVAVGTAGQFLRYYALNVDYVYLQPLQMAHWLQANTPPDATVAVHDTGLIRYVGGRTTIDMVGLTTPGAADYWRNGPGAVAEFLMDKRPDYIAAYGPGHGLGLGMIADTSIYGQPLASFPVTLDNNANVALAADFQGIYKPDWTLIDATQHVHQLTTLNYLDGFEEVDALDIADLSSERDHSYDWNNDRGLPGFPTEVHEFNCLSNSCHLVDSGRQINDREWYSFHVKPDQDVVLVMRVNPVQAGQIKIYAGPGQEADGHLMSARSLESLFVPAVATRWIPSIPGNWLEISTLIPAGYFNGGLLAINVEADTPNWSYSPYYVWAYQGKYQPESFSGFPVSTFQNGSIQLAKADIDYKADTEQAEVNLDWYTDGSATGDYKVFVHLYKDVNEPPVAQADTYPGGGTLPPGDWLPGVLRDTITVDLKGVPPGKYKVAIGLYNPYTNERLQPTGGDDQGRLFIGDVEIK